MGEHLPYKQRVSGSSPLSSTIVPTLVIEDDWPCQLTERDWEQKELSAARERFLRGLPAAERRLFLRRYWGCESLRELAAANGWSESKVKSMLFRTRKKLRDYLIKEGFACECGFPDAGHE